MSEYQKKLKSVLATVKKQGRDAFQENICSTQNPYPSSEYEVSDHEAKASAWSKGWHEEEKKSRMNKNSTSNKCTRCGDCGSKETYENQSQLPLNGKVVSIDWCIHHIVAALNAGGVKTVACCCGHGEQDGRIDLEDGRVLWIK